MPFNFPLPKSEKYALLVVNTYQLINALNDTLVQLLMLLNWGYAPSCIYILIDSDRDPRIRFLSNLVYRNEKLNIIYNNGRNFIPLYNNLLRTITVRAHSISSLYLSISGHGGRVKDLNNDEKDGLDECIYPGGIKVLDDDLYNGLRVLGSNFNVLCITDTCHSGTMFDLDRKEKLACTAYSISACADSEVDWEVGCDLTRVKAFLNLNKTNLSNLHYNQYLGYLPTRYPTGSLTSSLIKYGFEGLDESGIVKMSNELKNLGQKVIFSLYARDSPPASDPPTTTSSYWLIAVIIAVVLIIIIIVVAVYVSRPRVKQIRYTDNGVAYNV